MLNKDDNVTNVEVRLCSSATSLGRDHGVKDSAFQMFDLLGSY